MTTIENYPISPLIRLVNQVGKGLDRLGVAPFSFDPDELRAEAERVTGLNDWGDDDFWGGFEHLCAGFAADESQTLIGRMSLRMELVRRLKNRLLLEQSLKAHPEILQTPVRSPLFIIGFPRTGTTMLHHLLAQDPHVNVPLYWKLYTPLPLNVPQSEIDKRIASAERLMWLARFIAPKWQVIHPTASDAPEECVFLLSDNLTYAVRADIPDYVDWILRADLTPVYANFKQHLQALQWGQSDGRWVLKSPLHLWSLDALLNVFPDACIIQTRRSLTDAFPSWCSLVAALSKMQRKHVDLERIGAEWLDLWKLGIERADAARAAADPTQFLDVPYHELVADPLAMVRRIYDYFGFDLLPDAEAAMQRWLANSRPREREAHTYAIEQYGLTDADVEQALGSYSTPG